MCTPKLRTRSANFCWVSRGCDRNRAWRTCGPTMFLLIPQSSRDVFFMVVGKYPTVPLRSLFPSENKMLGNKLCSSGNRKAFGSQMSHLRAFQRRRKWLQTRWFLAGSPISSQAMSHLCLISILGPGTDGLFAMSHKCPISLRSGSVYFFLSPFFAGDPFESSRPGHARLSCEWPRSVSGNQHW